MSLLERLELRLAGARQKHQAVDEALILAKDVKRHLQRDPLKGDKPERKQKRVN